MNKKKNKLSPLSESTYYILLSLTKPLHGYGIIKKVEEITNKRLKLSPGTLYGAINTLLTNNLITLTSEETHGKRKKIYEIRIEGKKLLYYEINRLREMLNNGTNELGDYYE